VHLESIRSREVEQQRSLAGAHRDRVVISWQGADVAAAASAGERKICGWMLTLARARVIARGGRLPLVLFDDADAELDPGRLAAAWSLVADDLELFATSSRPEVWEGLRRERTWQLCGGRVEEA
jgi:recombinational DNA repair ATPase RecF